MIFNCNITKGRDSCLVLLFSQWCLKIKVNNQEMMIQKKTAELLIAPSIYCYLSGICIMKRIIGKTLDQCTQNQLDLITNDLKNILIILSENNIFHNDLHLKNIILDENNKIWIIDFGDAKISTNKDIYNISKFQISHSANCYGKKIIF